MIGASPRRSSWRSIVDVLALAPAIDTAAFPETPAEYFWTSSRVASTEDVWWAVNFNTGYINDNGAAAGTPHVRCVSGGRALAPSSGSGAGTALSRIALQRACTGFRSHLATRAQHDAARLR